MCSSTDSAVNTRQLLVNRMSAVRSAMPLLTDHLQLPLFTRQRRWHTMFGQLDQLTSTRCADAATFNVDDDILADSNYASLFDSSADDECHIAAEPMADINTGEFQAPYRSTNGHASLATAENLCTLETSPVMDVINNNFPALDENVDSVQLAVDQFMLNANVRPADQNTNCESDLASVTNREHRSDLTVNLLGCCSHECAASGGNQARTLRGRRHSDPGSIHSGSTSGSQSTSSNSDNWYYYDRRLGPGGPLAAQYGRLRTRRSLSVIVFPPSYDDVVTNVPGISTTHQCTSTADNLLHQSLIVSASAHENLMELPPPYQESERPPSYSEMGDAADVNEHVDDEISSVSSTYHEYSWPTCTQNWRACENNVLPTRCSNSHAMFVGRPAVRWNRNTRVERWTSSFNWVMS